MSHLTVLTGGRGGARFLAGVVDIRNEEEIHVVANVGSDFDSWGLHGSPDIDLVLNILSGELDPYQAEAPSPTFECYETMRKLGMALPSKVADRQIAIHLLRTQFLDSGMDLAGATQQLAERFGIGVALIPSTNDRLRTTLHIANDGVMRPEEYRSRCASGSSVVPEVERIAYEGSDAAKLCDRALDSVVSADRVVVAPGDPDLDIGALLSIEDLRKALGRTKAGVVAISPIVGSQAARGNSIRPGVEWSVVRFAENLTGVVDSLVIHTTDLDKLEAVRATGIDAWADNILINNREEASRLAGRVAYAGRMVARKR